MKGQQFWNDMAEVLRISESMNKELEEKGLRVHTTEGGVTKTNFLNDYDILPESFKTELYKWKEKGQIDNVQAFISTGLSRGMDWHSDDDPVIIHCLYGKSSYQIDRDDGPIVEVKAGETLYMPAEVEHWGMSDKNPRIILSIGVFSEVKPEDVTYHYNNLTIYEK